jgi:hypothetical protein
VLPVPSVLALVSCCGVGAVGMIEVMAGTGVATGSGAVVGGVLACTAGVDFGMVDATIGDVSVT